MIQDWFQNAKLGIFIHYGIYAVNSVSESWSFFNGKITYQEYMDQLEGFTAANLDMAQWVDLFKRSGARYVVLTAKHHDGVALWDTAASDLTVVKRTPAKRDIIAEYTTAMRDSGLKTGIYFSLIDWSEPLYPTIYAEGSVPGDYIHEKPFSSPIDGVERPELWQKFLEFNRAQIKELMTDYGKVDLLWFDGDWERSAEQWQMAEFRDYLHSLNPTVVLNSRLQGYGDYQTPEQGLPIVAPQGPWEFCTTINRAWGYDCNDHDYKTPYMVIRMFLDIISMGGNLLLDIGPREDGSIDERQVAVLETLGRWINTNAEAVYDTRAGIGPLFFNGGSTLSSDGCTLYLFVYDVPREAVCLKGLQVAIKRATLLHDGSELAVRYSGGATWNAIPAVAWIAARPDQATDYTTTIKIELEGPIKLYSGTGEVIAQG